MRAWMEIDMDNLKYNIEKIKELSQNSEIICVVKANCYGMGAVEVVKEMVNHGINFFGIASFEEGLELRQNNINADMLVLGSLFDDEIEGSVKEGFHVSINTIEQLQFIKEKKLDAKVHLKVDTGMGRIGFVEEDLENAYEYCQQNNIKVAGIYSHLSDADIDTEDSYNYTINQLNKFDKIEKAEKYKNVKYFHIFNSGAIVRYSDKVTGNAVRPGLCMYGMLGNERIEGFKSVFAMKGRVIYKRTVQEKTPISYSRTASIEAGETFATISVGYADGLKREFSNNMYVLVHGEKCPIIGNICMDMSIIKLPSSIYSKVKIGDEVTIYTDDIIKDIKCASTCSWEILTGIGRRVYRIYKKHGKNYKTVRWISED
jgi:alanine racemase